MNGNTWGGFYNTIGCSAMCSHEPPCPAMSMGRMGGVSRYVRQQIRNVSCACGKHHFRGRIMVASPNRPAISTKYTDMLSSSLQLKERHDSPWFAIVHTLNVELKIMFVFYRAVSPIYFQDRLDEVDEPTFTFSHVRRKTAESRLQSHINNASRREIQPKAGSQSNNSLRRLTILVQP